MKAKVVDRRSAMSVAGNLARSSGLRSGNSRRRFAIEAMFHDFKSHGWDMEASGLRHSAQFEHLLLVIAFAYVWSVMIGIAVVKRGLRYRLDRRARQDRQ